VQRITIRYGVDSIQKTFEIPVTIGQLRRNTEIRAALGYGDNIKLLMNGVEMPDTAIVPNEGVVVIETRANAKASRFSGTCTRN
jgi:hypothetical protein